MPLAYLYAKIKAAQDTANAAATAAGLGANSVAATGGSVQMLTGSKTWDPASVADGAMTSTTVTVTGAALGDVAIAAFSLAVTAGAVLGAVVTAPDTVTVTLFNKTGGALDLASGTLRAQVNKFTATP